MLHPEHPELANERMKLSTWSLKTGTFQLGKTTLNENRVFSGWGLGVRPNALHIKKYQL
jgi:hypothetical protein